MLLCFISFFTFGQVENETGIPYVVNYLPKDYNGHIQNWQIEQDRRGVMYFANGDGVLQFDGTKWRLHNIEQNSYISSIKMAENGRLYVGETGKFGYLEPNIQSNYQYKSLTDKLTSENKSFADIVQILNIDTTFFFQSMDKLFVYDQDTIITFEPKGHYQSCFLFNNSFYVQDDSQGLFRFYKNKLVLTSQDKLFIGEKAIFTKCLFRESMLVIDNKTGAFVYNPEKKEKKRFKIPNVNAIYNTKISHALFLDENLLALGTHTQGCILVDLKRQSTQVINSKNAIEDDVVYSMYKDKQNGLWLAQNNGISYIEINSPISSWSKKQGLQGTVNDIERVENTLYIAGSQGVAYLPSGKNNKQQNFVRIKNLHETARKILNASYKKQHTLFVGAADGLYEIKNFKAKKILNTTIIYSLFQSKIKPEIIYIGFGDGLGVLKSDGKQWNYQGKISGINQNLRTFYEEKNGNLWIGTFRNGVVKVVPSENSTKPKKIALYRKDKGLFSLKNNQVYPYDNFFVVCNSSGIFRHDLQKDSFIPDDRFGERFMKKHCVFEFCQISDEMVWLSGLNNKKSKTLLGKKTGNSPYAWQDVPFIKLPEMFITSSFLDKNKMLWFGGSEGLFRCDLNKKQKHEAIFPTLISQVNLQNDSVLFRGIFLAKQGEKQISSPEQGFENLQVLDYDNNSITFFYTIPAYLKPSSNKYSYMLEGYDEKWSSWSNASKKQYTNLKEGNYTFKVRGKDIYNVERKMATYSFVILPPCYRTWYAFFLYAVIFALLVALIIKIILYKEKQKNKKLKALVKERTKEILQQNEEIKSQNEEIQLQTENLQEQKELLEVSNDQLGFANSQLEKLSAIARETDNSVAILNPDGTFEWLNKSCKRIHGLSKKQIKKNEKLNIFKISINNNIEEHFKTCLQEKKSVFYESTIVRNDKKIWLQTTLTPLLDEKGNVKNLIAIDTDISQLKETEIKIEIQNKELINLNATKDKFFSIIAHDLKNPFNILRGFAELLVLFGRKMSPEKIDKYHKAIYDTAQNGYDLLQNLLEWSRAQTGRIKPSPEEFYIDEIVFANFELLKETAEQKKITLKNKADSELMVFADINMINTVLRNLLSNAIKFTHENGEVLVYTSVSKKTASIHVKDTGVGIAAEDISKLFRIDIHHSTEGTANEKGTGLGLILCKSFVEENNGKITVSSQINKGTNFVFTLPLYVANS